MADAAGTPTPDGAAHLPPITAKAILFGNGPRFARDAFGPVLGADPTPPCHPHDDRIVSLGLHHTIDTSLVHDVIIDAWWTRL